MKLNSIERRRFSRVLIELAISLRLVADEGSETSKHYVVSSLSLVCHSL